jgi:hypothetical protein
VKAIVYVYFSIITLSIVIMFKLWIVPYVLTTLFSHSDLVSRVYEIFIMFTGVTTLLLMIFLGYLGRHLYDLSLAQQATLNGLIQTPYLIHILAESPSINGDSVGFLSIFAEAWYGLVAEPIRFLFMVYPWTDIFALLLGFVCLSIGRFIEIVDEDSIQLHKKQPKKVGRT